ncbi:hypothetical protein KHC23_07675 [Ancylobacter dichloromethanicus]|uniref:Uncharacterized protein n=1 Tax=Ancylobacter dichloromethanicus TaxID=518825 RepID=A0A9W6MZX7_9HYPH|nr:hypothetical protein [Ancylobacter dichloromethanicus]MBS7553525.1 hypothetical protein [Ancylobacter dichloromethanicus]GLK72583.1 hypothetical protein GCM10017643_26990 [Ancylobacter dichloromethanicus]
MSTFRRRRQPEPPPAVIYREDYVAYVLCRAVNGGYCPCQVGKLRACGTMEIAAVQVLNQLERIGDVPRNPKGASGEGFL